MQVKSIAEYSKGSILQYFRPSLSYQLSLRPLFSLFLSVPLRQVLLYMDSALVFQGDEDLDVGFHLTNAAKGVSAVGPGFSLKF